MSTTHQEPFRATGSARSVTGDGVPPGPGAGDDPSVWSENLVRGVMDLVSIQKDRLAQTARAWLLRIGVGLALLIAGSLWLGSATLATIRGLRGGITELTGGRAWAGDLGAGVLALGVVALAVRLYVVRSTRQELDRLRAKYEPSAEKLDGRSTPTL